MVDVFVDAMAAAASTPMATNVAKTVSLNLLILILLSSNRHPTDATEYGNIRFASCATGRARERTGPVTGHAVARVSPPTWLGHKPNVAVADVGVGVVVDIAAGPPLQAAVDRR
jgi:hypothetical protein